MELTFTAVFEEIPAAEGGGFFATIEELPEVITEAPTLDEARRNLRDALELLLQDNRERTRQPQRGGKRIKEKITVPAA
jgi:predicted RNase H-like HicB family nuclease